MRVTPLWLGAAALALAPAGALAAEPRKPATPPHLAALQQADETGNYQVLAQLGSASFQAANPPQKLAQLFAPLRAYNINAVLVAEPKFTELPHLTGEGLMAMRGQYAIDGKLLQFTLIFQPEGGRWRMFGIGAELH